MSRLSARKLPPNPYKRSPIKKLEDLAGRAQERKKLRYYLNLAASGDNPHLALIGQRGSGKTSLLNAAEALARESKLLPVRLDMNELKAKSQGRFWHDLYQTLALSMVKVGCWGGEVGPIYAELLRMMHSRQPGALDKAVLQMPFVFSCNNGPIDDFDCPDALIINDFGACLTELRAKGFSGLAFLIDEADCLGKNVPLLQMFRNIFQVVDHCSLLLAGTEAVFPALSEVFSPIPRQFHRIDVRPFARWSDTMDLVVKPIPKDIAESILPTREVIRELHNLCGGAPDEIQLYCHHMYRAVEDGSSSQLNLSPQVFREVLKEYRSSTPANLEGVLNAIERLPDKLLFKSAWLSRRTLAAEENIRVSVLRREIRSGELLTPEQKENAAKVIHAGYRELFDAGITESATSLNIVGAPLTAGFWKSFVEAEKGKRWAWYDESFAEHLWGTIIEVLGGQCGGLGHFEIPLEDAGRELLAKFRAHQAINDTDESMVQMIYSAIFCRETECTHAVDVLFAWELPSGRPSTRIRFIEDPKREFSLSGLEQWLESKKAILTSNNITCTISEFDRWETPTSDELQQLAFITGYSLPAVLGPTLPEAAVAKFASGDIEGSAMTFEKMLLDKEDATARNNLAFCQILLGKVDQGYDNAARAVAAEYEPLFELNKAVAAYLRGDGDEAKSSLRHALKSLRTTENPWFKDAIYVLVLDPDGKRAGSQKNWTVEAGILVNLWRVGDISRHQLEIDLTKAVPDRAAAMLETLK